MNSARDVRTMRCRHCKELHLLEELPPSEGWHYFCPETGRFYPEKGGADEDG